VGASTPRVLLCGTGEKAMGEFSCLFHDSINRQWTQMLTAIASSRSTRSRRMSETVEVRRAASPAPVRIVREPERVERVIVEERRETRRERSRGDSDEVVVIEEHSPPRRSSKSKREKEKESGYRTVDPLAYGGVVGGRKERRGSNR
jgi:hypothetical protein